MTQIFTVDSGGNFFVLQDMDGTFLGSVGVDANKNIVLNGKNGQAIVLVQANSGTGNNAGVYLGNDPVPASGLPARTVMQDDVDMYGCLRVGLPDAFPASKPRDPDGLIQLGRKTPPVGGSAQTMSFIELFGPNPSTGIQEEQGRIGRDWTAALCLMTGASDTPAFGVDLATKGVAFYEANPVSPALPKKTIINSDHGEVKGRNPVSNRVTTIVPQ